MAHTNSTPNYNLPQFISSDKPAWLTDVNAAYSAIDTGMKNAQNAADDAQNDATQALQNSASAASTASSADAKGSGAIASLAKAFDTNATYVVGEYVIYNNLLYKCTTAVTTPGAWTGSANWTRATLDTIMTSLKIEDLSNVSIDTNDNGKLLGITVSGSAIAVGAVPINSQTLTFGEDTIEFTKNGDFISIQANNDKHSHTQNTWIPIGRLNPGFYNPSKVIYASFTATYGHGILFKIDESGTVSYRVGNPTISIYDTSAIDIYLQGGCMYSIT